jgi:hypothetical protein
MMVSIFETAAAGAAFWVFSLPNTGVLLKI